MLYGILFHSKSLPYECTIRFVEKLKGKKLRAPKKTKKWPFFVFWGARNVFPFNFIKQTFGADKDPAKYFLEKLHFRVKLQNLVIKHAYYENFSAKNENKNIYLENGGNILIYKIMLITSHKCKKLE